MKQMKPDQLLAWVFSITISIITVVIVFVVLLDFYDGRFDRIDAATTRWVKVFPLISGIVTVLLAAFLATYVVRYFRSSSGTLEMSVLGIKLKGPSGPILLWVVSFLAVAFILAVAFKPLVPTM
ncbi:hypothetical protein [Larkinella terrae]|uniref:Uncharacterized protein n=1 Tax=Larkinella terrae TaxID=2025311 RepID=A0A7K0EJ79_9BACT|nr:hypothetical protein [Larkinella terrae]MRS61903.1 hypothetical protein [Larkinella terrae]